MIHEGNITMSLFGVKLSTSCNKQMLKMREDVLYNFSQMTQIGCPVIGSRFDFWSITHILRPHFMYPSLVSLS